ncbi:DNA polymerase III [Sulfurovum lithotrophicum]|uniref:DNA polymerase beta n=1 Tax=Sulfurovum lithotrophicum TaxID=206403 RepID=A0A7U4M119_9BACT|nr:DNA polymerase/3'-5' exonuclease PolX [Sulfurovum lithotrophicum]AKF24857.1 DNA polymerase III [Sulfurovum lithotrophicum]
MTVSNAEIASIFTQMADLLEIRGEDPFRTRAYRNAARTIENLGKDLSKMVEAGEDISKIPTIGERIANKIREIVQTGRLAKLEYLKHSFPPHLLDILKIEGIGPKRAKILYQELHIGSLDALRKAAEAHKISQLRGFSEKMEQKILKGTMLAKKEGKRFLYSVAEPHAEALETYLKKFSGAEQVTVAGSFRRRKETVGDLDILATSKDPAKLIDYFVDYPGIKEIVSHGDTRSTVILNSDLQVDLRCVQAESYGAALHYFTGSKSHNIAVRIMARDMGMKVNEYGLFKDGKRIAGATEAEMYEGVGLRYIEPELRESRGEHTAARENRLPKLVKQTRIRGDLHMHTHYSDGHNSIEEMALAAKEHGYEYIAITDHSKHMSIVRGMDEKRAREQMAEIDRINAELKGISILKSVELDILEDGSLALPDSVLKEMDLVVAAVHDHFGLTQKMQTRRILKALENPYVKILVHPTGRLIGEREPYKVNMKQLFKGVTDNGCFLEINAQPKRLDLNDIYAKRAKEAGVRFAISTDSHNAASLDYMKYGVYQARRGWLEEKDVINTLSLLKLKKLLG